MDERTTTRATTPRCGVGCLLLLLAAGCTCGGEESPAPPGPVAAVVPSDPPSSPPPSTPRSTGLQPAAQPVLSAPVPAGFEREAPPGGVAPDRPWAHLRGRARLDDVVEFYTRHLEPGTPEPVGEEASGGATRPAPECRAWAVGPDPDCSAGTTCPAVRRCVLRHGGAVAFLAQRPRPPGESGALVNVTLTTVGGETRVTIENESLLRILRENVPDREFPPQPDLSSYRSFEEIPSEYID
ncbi:MAG: hypothetical protein JXB32_15120 [Deltaproteobacteria bacterium]|nr:hypothetical protein [Deltaproteobacteria bacterium]